MYGRLTIVLSLMLAPCLSVAVTGLDCRNHLSPTRIVVIEDPVRYTTDFTHSIAQLTRKHSAGARSRTLGLAEAELGYAIDTRIQTYGNPRSGPECVSPQIKVTLSYNPMTVYVASEYKKGTCQFDEVWRHEMRHVAVYRKHLATARAELEQELRKVISAPYYSFDTPGQGKQYLNEAIQSFWAERINHYIQGAREKQAAVDTPEEYARMAKTCGGIW